MNSGGAQVMSQSPNMSSKKSKQKPRYWNEEEDALLREAIRTHGTEGYHTWKEVAKHVPNRSYRECMQRWTKVLAPGLKKGKWSAEEDQLLVKLVTKQLETLGEGNGKRIVWNKVSQGFEGRSCKQCRERWINHLDPGVKKSEWSQDEDLTLLQLFETMPNKWAKIARQIPGRTENMVKVRWNALNRQAKKRKQNSLYYPNSQGRPNLPLNYMNPVGSFPALTQNQNPQNYNQFYINNSFSLSLNNPNNPGFQGPNGEGGQEYNPDGTPQNVDFRKNSLYLFPHGPPGSAEWNMNAMRFHQQKEDMQKSEYDHDEDKEGGHPNHAMFPKNMHDLRRTSSLAHLHKMNLLGGGTPGPEGERRMSFTIGGMNFEGEDENGTEPNNGRRLSSFLYQDLVKNMSYHQQNSGNQDDDNQNKRVRVEEVTEDKQD